MATLSLIFLIQWQKHGKKCCWGCGGRSAKGRLHEEVAFERGFYGVKRVWIGKVEKQARHTEGAACRHGEAGGERKRAGSGLQALQWWVLIGQEAGIGTCVAGRGQKGYAASFLHAVAPS